MIYLVTQQILPPTDAYKIVSVEESLRLLEPLTIVGLDTETQGFNPHLKELLLVQLGNFDFQVVIDTTTVDTLIYKNYLESDRLFIIQNASFDLKFFYKKCIIINRIWDTFLAEKLLYLGYPSGIHSLSLKTMGHIYCNIELDKSVRGKILWSKTLSDDIVVYSANDVKYLPDIMEQQRLLLKIENLLNAIDIENQYIRVNAYLEFCGVKLDVPRWKAKMKSDKERLIKAELELNKWVEDFYNEHRIGENTIKLTTFIKDYSEITYDKKADRDSLQEWVKDIISKGYERTPSLDYTEDAIQYYGFSKTSKFNFCTVNLQGDLFMGIDSSPRCNINWNSSKQVIPLLELLGFDLTSKDKNGSVSKSIEAKIVKPQSSISTITPIYLAYKESQKVVSTYGQNFIDSINPRTGRIYTSFNALGADTARLSSGGGEDKETIPGKKLPLINLQNLPNDTETRGSIICEKGNRFISIDYHGQESFLMASIANDKAMLKELTVGSMDMHSLVASMVFDEIPKDMPTKDIAKKFKALRQEAKGYEFCFNYSGNDSTLVRNYGISPIKAKHIYDNYLAGFSGLRDYQKTRKKDVMEKGYILLSPISCYRAHIYDWDKLQSIKAKFNQDFWAKYRDLKESGMHSQIVDDVRYFFKRKAACEKQSVNYPIQHAGAMTFKLAGVYFFKWIVDNNLFNIVLLCIGAHDEFCIEAPKDIAENVAKVLKECMEKSGAIFCTRAKLTADAEISDHWVH